MIRGGIEELRAIADAPPDERLLLHGRGDVGPCTGSSRRRRSSELAAHEFARAAGTRREEQGGPDLMIGSGGPRPASPLLRSNIEDAQRWSITVKDPFWGPISRARVELSVGNLDAARELIAEAEVRCVRHEVVKSLLTARSASSPDEAMSAVTHAVEVASFHGMLQTVANVWP